MENESSSTYENFDDPMTVQPIIIKSRFPSFEHTYDFTVKESIQKRAWSREEQETLLESVNEFSTDFLKIYNAHKNLFKNRSPALLHLKYNQLIKASSYQRAVFKKYIVLTQEIFDSGLFYCDRYEEDKSAREKIFRFIYENVEHRKSKFPSLAIREILGKKIRNEQIFFERIEKYKNDNMSKFEDGKICLNLGVYDEELFIINYAGQFVAFYETENDRVIVRRNK